MFLKTAAASAALAFPAIAVAQSPQAAARLPPGKGGLSRTRLACMRGAMARHVESGRMPGLVTLVSRRGETHVDVRFAGRPRGQSRFLDLRLPGDRRLETP
jgi:hypothetical protein